MTDDFFHRHAGGVKGRCHATGLREVADLKMREALKARSGADLDTALSFARLAAHLQRGLASGALPQVPIEQQLHALDLEIGLKVLFAVSGSSPSVPLGYSLRDALLERGDLFLQGHHHALFTRPLLRSVR
ncbi:MAG TPA: hypothetical protein VFU71_18000 [Burkholderiaceae bacterium]|nr:hypothetical protein [Burkholderiaceae bacterium]